MTHPPLPPTPRLRVVTCEVDALEDVLSYTSPSHPTYWNRRGDVMAALGEDTMRGLMVGMEFVKDRRSKERAIELRNDVIQRAFEKGLLLIPCGTNSIRMTPPLNIERPLVEEGLFIFESAMTEAEEVHLRNGA